MRRMVKENLLKFDATPLFPERIANTVPCKLSDGEAKLYKSVTDYVRGEFNRAEALQNDKRAGTVGFALTILQRRARPAGGDLYPRFGTTMEWDTAAGQAILEAAGVVPRRDPWPAPLPTANPALRTTASSPGAVEADRIGSPLLLGGHFLGEAGST